MVTFKEAQAAKDAFLASPQATSEAQTINGIGIGYLDPNDEKKGAAVVIYLKSGDLNIPEAIRATIDGKEIIVPTRVDVTGEFIANLLTPDAPVATAGHPTYSQRIRPVPAGYSVGHPGASGTAGLIVINSALSQLYILSNNHVLNKDNSAGYTETIQPGGADHGSSGSDTIGSLDRFIPLKSSDNYLDAATAIPTNNLLDPVYATRGSLPGHYQQVVTGWNLYKVGRTTGPRTGRVDAVNVDNVSVNYRSYGGLGSIGFNKQVVVKSTEPVSLPGDSGSVWLRAEDNYAALVNYAGSADGKTSTCFPVQWFMQIFGCLVARSGFTAAESKEVPSKIDESICSVNLEPELIASLTKNAISNGS